MKRAIQKEVENPLALKLIEGSFREGDAIRVDADAEGRITFEQAASSGERAEQTEEREPVTA